MYLKNHTITTGIDYKRFKDNGDKNFPDDFRSPFRNLNYVNSDVLGIFVVDDVAISEKFIISPGIRYSSYKGNAGPAGEAEGIQIYMTYGIQARQEKGNGIF